MAKLGRTLVDGVTGNEQAGSAVESSSSGSVVTQAVKPQFFKALVGKGHPEFSSPRQQVCKKKLNEKLRPNCLCVTASLLQDP